VSCGCFGRGSVDVRIALARNVALGVAAAAAWSWAPSRPVLGFPVAGDSTPALLVAGSLAVAAWTVWRSSSGLGRGRA